MTEENNMEKRENSKFIVGKPWQKLLQPNKQG